VSGDGLVRVAGGGVVWWCSPELEKASGWRAGLLPEARRLGAVEQGQGQRLVLSGSGWCAGAGASSG
jgi:hypothetical protein